MKVDFIDLTRQNKNIYKDIKGEIEEAILKSEFILGDRVKKFEDEFAKFFGSKYSLGIASGTDGILLSLMSLGINKGDEVIVPAFTFTGSITPIIQLGAIPVLADTLPDSPIIDPGEIEKKITKKTRALIVVHMYGLSCEMKRVIKIAKENNIPVIEDTSQALGSKYDNKFLGTIGDLGVFSLYPTKNLGAFGDAGIVATNNKILFEKMKVLRNHGQVKKNVHTHLGINSRLDNIQAIVLSQKLKNFQNDMGKRKKITKLYYKYFAGTEIISVRPFPNTDPNLHLFTIITKKRDELQKYLLKKGIQTGIYYPTPIHKQIFFKKIFGSLPKLPNAEKFARTHLALPFYPGLKTAEIEYVIKNIKKFLTKK